MLDTISDILENLAAVVGKDNVVADAKIIAAYSHDQSFGPRRRPSCVAFPHSTEEVQEIVRLANKSRVPVVPRSSPVGLYGASIPNEGGGIVIDLKRMNRILEINDRNWYAIVEPGVSVRQLHEELQKRGFRVAAPLFEPPSASVVSCYLERSPVVTAADFTYGSEHIISYKAVMATGETFTVGHPPLERTPASAPDGPGLNFYRIFQGAQGTLGIVTWMVVRVLPMPKARKVFFFPCPSQERAIEVMRRIQRSELGLECFALNGFDLAALLVEETPEQAALLRKGEYIGPSGATPWSAAQLSQFEQRRKTLPAWTVVLCLSAVGPLPDEKIAYQELDLKEAMTEIGTMPQHTVGGIPALDRLVLDELLQPWRMQKRFGYRGSCHSLLFCSSPDRVGEFHARVESVALQFGYPNKDIGVTLLPMERARAFYCSYDFYCDLTNREETQRVSLLFDEASELLIDKGAFFDRPYGKWAEKVYRRTGQYADYLRKIKRELDPNNIMNPGKLCF